LVPIEPDLGWVADVAGDCGKIVLIGSASLE
jgi:hypothetical protein